MPIIIRKLTKIDPVYQFEYSLLMMEHKTKYHYLGDKLNLDRELEQNFHWLLKKRNNGKMLINLWPN